MQNTIFVFSFKFYQNYLHHKPQLCIFGNNMCLASTKTILADQIFSLWLQFRIHEQWISLLPHLAFRYYHTLSHGHKLDRAIMVNYTTNINQSCHFINFYINYNICTYFLKASCKISDDVSIFNN